MVTEKSRKLARVKYQGEDVPSNTSRTKVKGIRNPREAPGTRVVGTQMASPISKKKAKGGMAPKAGKEQHGSGSKVTRGR